MIKIRPMTSDDWPAVAAIHREGIATGHATFETQPPSWIDFDAAKLDAGRLVAVDGDTVLAWTALSPASARPVYRGVAEHSVYVAKAARGRRIGSALLRALIVDADHADLWTLQSSIFPENTTSLALHDRAGFRRVGTRERIARMEYGPCAGLWRDTIPFERRRP